MTNQYPYTKKSRSRILIAGLFVVGLLAASVLALQNIQGPKTQAANGSNKIVIYQLKNADNLAEGGNWIEPVATDQQIRGFAVNGSNYLLYVAGDQMFRKANIHSVSGPASSEVNITAGYDQSGRRVTDIVDIRSGQGAFVTLDRNGSAWISNNNGTDWSLLATSPSYINNNAESIYYRPGSPLYYVYGGGKVSGFWGDSQIQQYGKAVSAIPGFRAEGNVGSRPIIVTELGHAFDPFGRKYLSQLPGTVYPDVYSFAGIANLDSANSSVEFYNNQGSTFTLPVAYESNGGNFALFQADGPIRPVVRLPACQKINKAGSYSFYDTVKSSVAPSTGFIASVTSTCASLKIETQVINDNGGSATADQFSIHIVTGPGAAIIINGLASPGGTYDIGTGTFMVSPVGKAGYTIAVSGDCSGDGSVALGSGETKTCTVIANDIGTGASSLCSDPTATNNGGPLPCMYSPATVPSNTYNGVSIHAAARTMSGGVLQNHSSVKNGEEVQFTLTVSNSERQAKTVDVRFSIPAPFTYVDRSARFGGITIPVDPYIAPNNERELIWGTVDIPANAERIITFRAVAPN